MEMREQMGAALTYAPFSAVQKSGLLSIGSAFPVSISTPDPPATLPVHAVRSKFVPASFLDYSLASPTRNTWRESTNNDIVLALQFHALKGRAGKIDSEEAGSSRDGDWEGWRGN